MECLVGTSQGNECEVYDDYVLMDLVVSKQFPDLMVTSLTQEGAQPDTGLRDSLSRSPFSCFESTTDLDPLQQGLYQFPIYRLII